MVATSEVSATQRNRFITQQADLRHHDACISVPLALLDVSGRGHPLAPSAARKRSALHPAGGKYTNAFVRVLRHFETGTNRTTNGTVDLSDRLECQAMKWFEGAD